MGAVYRYVQVDGLVRNVNKNMYYWVIVYTQPNTWINIDATSKAKL